MENIQVRFANISIKASDEFMLAVDEERQFHNGEFLIYKKAKNNAINAIQDFENTHYSINIPSKDIQKVIIFKMRHRILKISIILRISPRRISMIMNL